MEVLLAQEVLAIGMIILAFSHQKQIVTILHFHTIVQEIIHVISVLIAQIVLRTAKNVVKLKHGVHMKVRVNSQQYRVRPSRAMKLHRNYRRNVVMDNTNVQDQIPYYVLIT